MPGFGTILGGFGQAYPQYQAQQQDQQMNKLKLQQAMTQMAQEQATRKAQADALKAFGGVNGSGPGGVITPQQLAQASQNNPEAFNMLNTAVRPTNAGLYNLQGRDLTGQYGLDRTQMQGDNRMQAVNAQQEGANSRNQLTNQTRTDTVNQQQMEADKRNANSVNARKTSASNPINLAAMPEFKTAKAQFDQAKQDERAIERNYQMQPAQAYSDPQWLDARKRSLAASAKLEAIQSKVAKAGPEAPAAAPAAAAGAPVKVTSDEDYEKLPPGTQFVDPEGNVRTKPQG